MTIQLPAWPGPSDSVPVGHARAPWLATAALMTLTYAVLSLITLSHLAPFIGGPDARYNDWVHRPLLVALLRGFGLSALTLLPFLIRRLPLWGRFALIGALLAATVPSVVAGLAQDHSRRHVAGAVMAAARALPLPDGASLVKGPAFVPADPRPYLTAPDVSLTWSTSSSPCDTIAAYAQSRPGWRYYSQQCLAEKRRDGPRSTCSRPTVSPEAARSSWTCCPTTEPHQRLSTGTTKAGPPPGSPARS